MIRSFHPPQIQIVYCEFQNIVVLDGPIDSGIAQWPRVDEYTYHLVGMVKMAACLQHSRTIECEI